MDVCSIRHSQPRSAHVRAIRSCLNSLYPESTLTATSENRMGARCRRMSSVCSSAQLSLPPDRPTMTRSPSSSRLKSVIALVVFLAMRASSGLGKDIYLLYPFRNLVRGGGGRGRHQGPPHHPPQMHEVRDHLEGARQPIFRLAEAPGPVVHDHLRHASAQL